MITSDVARTAPGPWQKSIPGRPTRFVSSYLAVPGCCICRRRVKILKGGSQMMGGLKGVTVRYVVRYQRGAVGK